MRKFGVIFKEKQDTALQLHESVILKDFKKVYSALLEKYEIKTADELDESTQAAFITELSNYWDEQSGISEKGNKFVRTRSTFLTENSTPLQKKNYLKSKVSSVINESLRQGDVKWKIYDVIDEMYREIKASNISDILSPDMIRNIIHESFQNSIEEFTKNIATELKESAKPVEKKKFVVKIDTRK